MSTVQETAKGLLKKEGRTQAWVINKMNAINPEISMNRNKMSAIMTGNRKMSGDELLAFCMALEITPDTFIADEKHTQLI